MSKRILHSLDIANVDITIRTKTMKEGIANYWSYNDVAHIWIGGNLAYRITKKGTLIEMEWNE